MAELANCVAFCVVHPGEPAAGLVGYTDHVTVSVSSGHAGGECGEFIEHMRSALAEWFEGASVTVDAS